MVLQGMGQSGKSFVGVISDTHGLVRPQALAVLAGAERIIHAGDIGRPKYLKN
jgi:predicted phosphodiesterase